MNRSIPIILISLIIAFQPSFAQIYDDFSDGDLHSNPQWKGDLTHFEINSQQQLHLKNQSADTSQLWLSFPAQNNYSWEFWIKQSFNSSANNHGRVFLLCDSLDGNGFYLQLGGSDDSVRFVHKTGSTYNNLAVIPQLFTGNSTNALRFRIELEKDSIWSFYADGSGGQNLQFLTQVAAKADMTMSCFGLWLKYTSSNSSKTYFDDLKLSPLVSDNLPPELIASDYDFKNRLSLQFNEALDKATATNRMNYLLDFSLLPDSVELNATNAFQVDLYFPIPLHQQNQHYLLLNDICDLKGNCLYNDTLLISTYRPRANDVVINEIMPISNAQAHYPCEYIELYNRVEYPIQLKNWQLILGSSTKTLSDFTLYPDSFLILCHEDHTPYLIHQPHMGFSSFSISNSQQLIQLRTPFGAIHAVDYSDEFFHHSTKASGGYSVEMSDPDNPCAGKENWRVSRHLLGGSPGLENTVKANYPDKLAPYIEGIAVSYDGILQLHFSESMDSLSLYNKSLLISGFDTLRFRNFKAPFFRDISIALNKSLHPDSVYSFPAPDSLCDCVMNTVSSSYTYQFGLAKDITAGDLIINEVMYDPDNDGIQYIEIMNRSEKIIELCDLYMGTYDSIAQIMDELLPLCPYGRQLLPGELVALCSNKILLNQKHLNCDIRRVIEVEKMPSLSKSGKDIAICNSEELIIDHFAYSEDLHSPFLHATKGVALERIAPDAPTNSAQNWTSAAEMVNFGSPTQKNSQALQETKSDALVSLSSEIFSPDNNGYQDYCQIDYQFENAGNMLEVNIYDQNGYCVRHLCAARLCGSNEVLIWKGLDDHHQLLPEGLYIIHSSISRKESGKTVFKKSVVALVYPD